MRVLYESEKIFMNGDGWIVADFYVKSAKLVFEIDGAAHDLQGGYDVGRDRWLPANYGVRTIRFINKQVLSRNAKLPVIVAEALNLR